MRALALCVSPPFVAVRKLYERNKHWNSVASQHQIPRKRWMESGCGSIGRQSCPILCYCVLLCNPLHCIGQHHWGQTLTSGFWPCRHKIEWSGQVWLSAWLSWQHMKDEKTVESLPLKMKAFWAVIEHVISGGFSFVYTESLPISELFCMYNHNSFFIIWLVEILHLSVRWHFYPVTEMSIRFKGHNKWSTISFDIISNELFFWVLFRVISYVLLIVSGNTSSHFVWDY